VSETETADVTVRAYPTRWGTPPGTPASEERQSWVKRNVRLEQVRNLDLAVIAHRALFMHRDAPADAQLALEAARAEAQR
jgi:hypothetical protein